MPATEPSLTLDQRADLGSAEVYVRRVLPLLVPADVDKFVTVDIHTGEYEADEDDYEAVTRLRARCPAAEIWLERFGHRTAYRTGGGR